MDCLENANGDSMKKIGIMTLYKNNVNYGGLLQAYALQQAVQTILGDTGECVQISYSMSTTPFKEKLKHSLQYRSGGETLGMAMNQLKKILDSRTKNINLLARKKSFQEFEASIPHTETAYTFRTIAECADEFTHLITGSDQVWNGGVDLSSFCLDFAAESTKKISYAASSASTKFGKWQDEIFRKELPKFTAISIREKSVASYFKEMSGREVTVVLDPVFLFSKEEWHRVSQKPKIDAPYIFCYLLGNSAEQHERAKEIARENNCKLVTVPYLNGYNQLDDDFGDVQLESADPREFLGWIENAAAIVTDSFHATAFSLIFNKPFWVLPRFKNQKSINNNHRVTDILEQVGLLDCFSNRSNRISAPDYSNANIILNTGVKQSYGFLKAALGETEC